MQIREYKTLNKSRGFTLIEILIAVGVIVFATPFILSLVNDSNEKQRAIEYADQSKLYAKSFINAIKWNYASYYDYAVKNPNTTQVLKYSDIKKQGFAPVGNLTKLLDLQPCVAMKYNATAKEMQAIMFYTNDNKSPPLTKLFVAKTMKIYGAGGGYYDNGTVIGSGGGWSLPSGNAYVSSSVSSSCDSSTLTQYGLVVNLNLDDSFPKVTDTANYLGRNKDNSATPGDVNNANTMQTDIIMDSQKNGKSGIFLQGTSQSLESAVFLGSTKSNMADDIYWKTSNKFNQKSIGLVVTNGSMQANQLMATQFKKVFSICDPSDLGAIVKQEMDAGLPIASQLVCSKNTLQCKGQDPNNNTLNGYCYLPSSDISIRYHPNMERFTCTNGYIDPTVPATGIEAIQYKPGNFNLWCTWGCKPKCDSASLPYGEYVALPQSTVIINDPATIKTIDKYSVYTGVFAQTTWVPVPRPPSGTNCDFNENNFSKIITAGIVSSVTCTTANPVIDSN